MILRITEFCTWGGGLWTRFHYTVMYGSEIKRLADFEFTRAAIDHWGMNSCEKEFEDVIMPKVSRYAILMLPIQVVNLKLYHEQIVSSHNSLFSSWFTWVFARGKVLSTKMSKILFVERSETAGLRKWRTDRDNYILNQMSKCISRLEMTVPCISWFPKFSLAMDARLSSLRWRWLLALITPVALRPDFMCPLKLRLIA